MDGQTHFRSTSFLLTLPLLQAQFLKLILEDGPKTAGGFSRSNVISKQKMP